MNRSLVLIALLFTTLNASAQEGGRRECRNPRFGINNSDEVCALVTPGKRSTLLRLVTDVASYDPAAPMMSRQSVGAAICKLFNFGPNVLLSMSFRKAEQAGFIGGGAIIGGGFQKIPVVDTIRCENR